MEIYITAELCIGVLSAKHEGIYSGFQGDLNLFIN